MYTIGDRLKALRKHRQVSQLLLAREIDVSHSTITAIETNRISPPETLKTIAMYFKVNSDWLIKGEGEAPTGIVLTAKNESNDPWKDEAYNRMKDEISFYRGIIEKLVGVVPNFPKSPNLSGTKLRVLRGGVQLGDYLGKVA